MRMRILFVLHYPGYLRYFDSAIAELAARGHRVHLVFDAVHKQNEGLAGIPRGRRISHGESFPRGSPIWQPFARDLRQVADYVHYLHPRYAKSDYLRDRVALRLPTSLRLLSRLNRLPAWLVDWLVALLRALEAALPIEPSLRSFLRRDGADLVIVSPLITVGSRQPDVVVAAKALGLPVILAVASWDHLTTKGMVRAPVDHILVWNGLQREEAISVHNVIPERVTVTGAQPFDKWFTQPVSPKAEFAARVGLPADQPMILFVGSTKSISEPAAELDFVRRWLAALRQSGDHVLRDAAVLVRPHPYGGDELKSADLSSFGAVSVYPRADANPVDPDDRRDYFDSLAHADAVVGINTSAMIEAAIAGRPVFSIETGEFAATQSGTLHFRYLLPENGGFVHSAGSIEEHITQLADVMQGADVDAGDRTRAFVERFVRPHGLETPATPRFADAVEAVAADPAAGVKRLPREGAARMIVSALALARASQERTTFAWVLQRGSQAAAARARERARTSPPRLKARLIAAAGAFEDSTVEYEKIAQAKAPKGKSTKPSKPKQPAATSKPKASKAAKAATAPKAEHRAPASRTP